MICPAQPQPPQELARALAAPGSRRDCADRLAALLEARALVVLLWDDEVGAMQPAPGFRQTLPGGAGWRQLLARCAEPGEFDLQVDWEGRPGGEVAHVFVSCERSAVVLVGERPRLTPRQLSDSIPLLLPLLRSEMRERAALARARSAVDAHRRASALASALDQARRQAAADAAALQATAADLAEELRSLEILDGTGALIGSQLDPDGIVQGVVDAGVALTGAAIGAFFYDGASGEESDGPVGARSGAAGHAFATLPDPGEAPVLSPAPGGLVRSDDITADPRFLRAGPHRGVPAAGPPVRSYLAVPVVSRSGAVIGRLVFGHPDPGRFTARHQRLMAGIAVQAAVAIDNARLYRAAQREIQQRERVEAARELLMREVDHRARNALTVVQAILQLTRADDLERFRRVVIGRVHALARAQGALAARKWQGALLREVVTAGVTAGGTAAGEIARFRLEGPEVELSPGQVQAFSLIVHELATNARDYGALSSPKGRVVVSWAVAAGGGEDRLTWTERGGPPAARPLRSGFGSRLMRELAAQIGAGLETVWDPAGLTVSLRGPAGMLRRAG